MPILIGTYPFPASLDLATSDIAMRRWNPLLISWIVASSLNGVIGRGLDIPWHAKGEQARFRVGTMGKYVLMGRKTYESLPGPLVGRNVMVLSRTLAASDECIVVRSIEEAMDIATHSNAEELVIGGGAEIYERALPFTDVIYHSWIHLDVDGDIMMPSIGDDFIEIWSKHFELIPSYTYRTLVKSGLQYSAVDDKFGFIALPD